MESLACPDQCEDLSFLSVEQEVALAAATAFLGAPPENVNADVIDTVGELTNMIGGSSKDR